MPNFHIASITLYSQDNGLSVSSIASSAISPSTISMTNTNTSSFLSNYPVSPTVIATTTNTTNFSVGGGSGGGNTATRRGHPGYQNKQQQSLNNRYTELDVDGDSNDNDKRARGLNLYCRCRIRSKK